MELNKQEQQLVALLPKGRVHPRKIKEIAGLMEMDARTVRFLVSHLITVHGCPIGSPPSNPAGYYWIENETERAQALGPLNAQVGKMAERISALANHPIITKEEVLKNQDKGA